MERECKGPSKRASLQHHARPWSASFGGRCSPRNYIYCFLSLVLQSVGSYLPQLSETYLMKKWRCSCAESILLRVSNAARHSRHLSLASTKIELRTLDSFAESRTAPFVMEWRENIEADARLPLSDSPSSVTLLSCPQLPHHLCAGTRVRIAYRNVIYESW